MLERFPFRWNHLKDKKPHQDQNLEHIPVTKYDSDLAGYARGFKPAVAFLIAAIAVVITTVLLPATAKAEDLGPTFRQLITSQISAFRSDDADVAFSFAAPNIKQRFQKPDIFLKMVRQGYRPVYRPKSVTFGQQKNTSYGPTQEVHVTGPEGKDWLVLYTFEQQGDGSWKISGCYLTEDPGEAT